METTRRQIWQCDATGYYSEYSQPGYDGTGQTYLRGTQVSDANGQVTFTTIYPGWYQGRVTHIHVKVSYGGTSIKVTQLAFPEATTQLVYSTVAPYNTKGQNSITNTTDNVFSDGTSTEMVTLTGNTTTGYTAALTIGVAATVTNTNTAPVISAIADQRIDANTSTGALTFTVTEIVDSSFGIDVTFTEPGVAERAMYFGSTAARLWTGGHESAGVNLPSKNWFLAEGAIGTFFDTYILLSNANSYDVTATLTFLLESGATITHTVRIAATGRTTINIEQVSGMPAGAAVATTVNATGPIVAERSMYWPDGGWVEAHNSFGVTELGTKWAFAEGRVGGTVASQTYILLANPGSSPASVTITYLREGSAPIVQTHNVPATSRMTVAPAEYGLVDENFGALVVATASIAAERALYWTCVGVFWAAGTNATATRLP